MPAERSAVASVRAARPEDAEAIAAIYNAGIAERSSTFETAERTPDDIRGWLAAGERWPVLVADTGERGVLGWARVAPYSDRPAYSGVGEVSVYVSREARGRGVGRGLVEALHDQARACGHWKLTGKLSPTTPPAPPS